jgi:hypothetical protein
MRGFLKSSSERPEARSMARAGARCAPSVRVWLRGLEEFSLNSESLQSLVTATIWKSMT